LDADLREIGLTKRSQAAIQDIAQRCVEGLWLDPGASREDVREQLLAVTGVGPWTANYVAMRALRDPDILLSGDLIVRRNAQRLGLSDNARELEVHGQAWAPWRTYATHHLWAAPSAADHPKGPKND
jgi:AraC family transcriptional regulator of adaptative response / DNA-3-methyladenine glycosylase II